jgi:nucleotide-binding universal stress UspA family protein
MTMPGITRLLVPTDFSPTSDLALQCAIDIAPSGASIHVMHVVDNTSLATAYPDGFYVEPPGLRALLIDDARSAWPMRCGRRRQRT